MPTIEQLIAVLLPLLPAAEITLDNHGQVVIYTGLTAPAEPAWWARRAWGGMGAVRMGLGPRKGRLDR